MKSSDKKAMLLVTDSFPPGYCFKFDQRIKAFLKRNIKGHNTFSIWKPNKEKLELRSTVRLTPISEGFSCFPALNYVSWASAAVEVSIGYW